MRASTSILRSCPTRSERYAVPGLLQLEFNLADGGAVGVFGASASRLTAGAAGFLELEPGAAAQTNIVAIQSPRQWLNMLC